MKTASVQADLDANRAIAANAVFGASVARGGVYVE
jgi:hypothetical protein